MSSPKSPPPCAGEGFSGSGSPRSASFPSPLRGGGLGRGG